MLAKSIPSILSPLSTGQTIITAHFHKLTEKIIDNAMTNPPFRSPHHSSSRMSNIGSRQHAKPGEISLSHNEDTVFRMSYQNTERNTLSPETTPLVALSREGPGKKSVTYPAQFMLAANKNTCPSGHYVTKKNLFVAHMI